MKILEINKFYYPRRGAERHFLDVIDLLRQYGHDVAVFAMDDERNVSREDEKHSVSYVGYNQHDATLWQRLKGIGRLFWSSEARRKLARLLDEYRPDIVHIHNIYHQLSLSILPIIRKRGIPIVMTVHDYHLVSPDKDQYHASVGRSYWKFLFVKKYGFGKRLLLVLKMYWERCFRFYEQAVDFYMAPSEYCKKILVRGGVAAEKIRVVPHFVASIPQQAIPEEDGGYALYFGALSAGKGVDTLVALFERLGYPLVLAGSAEPGFVPKDNRWAQMVGQKSQAELIRLIRKAKFVVSGSMLPETFGLIALEAFACGKPFFGLQAGALPEIVMNGKNGILAASWEDLEKNVKEFLSGNVQLLDGITIRKQALEHFDEERYLTMMQGIFDSVRSKY